MLNVGAGTGSYEPAEREVTAVEPSAVMRAQRAPDATPCIAAIAEALPFPDQSFDAAMAVLSDHHWTEPLTGLSEMRRVARRVVVFTWDLRQIPRFWLVRDYFPDYAKALADAPSTIEERAGAIDASVHPVAIPWDCVDGFFHAYWRRPDAYLDPTVRDATSAWSRLEPTVVTEAIGKLADDLESGAWVARNRELLGLEAAELGARLLIADTGSGG
ncbi:MAG TPA: methyltransferase domain-containing protein [Solirubrobacterales bacterium]|nr:methyltransferase domain-containing protein [Solirubrobacterales bacterium]